MSDDGPNFSRNIVQRRQLVSVVVVASFVLTLSSVWVGVANLIADLADLAPFTAWMLVQGTAIVAGTLVAVFAGYFANRLHRALWPEHPSEDE